MKKLIAAALLLSFTSIAYAAGTPEGNQSDPAYSGSGDGSIIAILKAIYNAASSSIAAGANIIGRVGIDQTTPGTTNAVAVTVFGSGAVGGVPTGLKTCDLHAKYDASTSGATRLVTGIASRKVYICGFERHTGTTATNVKLIEGTGSNCGTGSADITPAYQMAANVDEGFMSAFWTGLASATNADDVCINASAANAVQADLWYTIQ